MKTWTRPLAGLSFATLAALSALPAMANDFPTTERVSFVLECMREHPGAEFEMSSKCSCAVDAVASEISFDEYRTMHTAALANSISGERGGYYRGKHWRGEVRKYDTVLAKAKKACFIDTTAAQR